MSDYHLLNAEKEKRREERDARRERDPEYENVAFDNSKTENIRHRFSKYYPLQGDSIEQHEYLERERASASKPSALAALNEMDRAHVTAENQQACIDRQAAKVETRDFAYEKDHPLHSGYQIHTYEEKKRDAQRVFEDYYESVKNTKE
ncbi:hypothetical protein ABEF95_016375 [Exophiala dermatitidis]